MKTDEHLTILMSIQKQLGELSTATGRQDEILQRIDTQVQKTNGRVTRLEEINVSLKEKEAESRGEAKVKSAVWGFVGALGLFAIQKFISQLF